MMKPLALLFALSFAVQTRTASIEGVVVEAGNSQPVMRAVVQLEGGASGPLAMVTGADGRFGFQNLAAGSYRLTVSRNGFLNSAYGQRGPNGKGSSLVVPAGQAMKDIRLTMVATAAISGRVFDQNGEPLVNARVQALKYSYASGQKTLTAVKNDQTNDRGEYRLFWLPPGQYYINATSQSGQRGGAVFVIHSESLGTKRATADGRILTDNETGPEKLGEADVAVFYPGTPDAQAAQAVNAGPGADIGGVDFTLLRVKTRSVQGFVFDVVTGQPVNAGSVSLVPRGPSVTGSMSAPLNEGQFSFRGVLPGSYFVVAMQRSNSRNGNTTMRGGRVPVDVGAADVEGLSVVLSLPVEISGDAVTEGRPAGRTDGLYTVVSLKNETAAATGTASFGTAYGSFKEDQQFTIDPLIPGDYRVQVENLPQGAYVKSIRFGGEDVLNGTLQISQRSSDRLSIVLSTNSGAVEGTVTVRNGAPLSSAAVALVPDASHRQRADLYRSAYTDDSGRFRLEGISPGVYVLFSWEDIEDGLWHDPEFIRRSEAAGKVVRITEGGRESVELSAIPFAY